MKTAPAHRKWAEERAERAEQHTNLFNLKNNHFTALRKVRSDVFYFPTNQVAAYRGKDIVIDISPQCFKM